MCYISYRIDFDGVTGRISSSMGYSYGLYKMGITDPREQLDAATTIEEVADILADALRLILTRRDNKGIQRFKQLVMDAEDIDGLLDIRVNCKRVAGGEGDDSKTGVAYQLTYDFPSRTGSFCEARLCDGEVTFSGDPFVNEKGEEYNPLKNDM